MKYAPYIVCQVISIALLLVFGRSLRTQTKRLMPWLVISTALMLMFGLPVWGGVLLGVVMAVLFAYPPVALTLGVVLCHPLVWSAAGLGVHVYTAVVALQR
jgi:hypothetical protein